MYNSFWEKPDTNLAGIIIINRTKLRGLSTAKWKALINRTKLRGLSTEKWKALINRTKLRGLSTEKWKALIIIIIFIQDKRHEIVHYKEDMMIRQNT